jgi:outer membrane protein insertion porin family
LLILLLALATAWPPRALEPRAAPPLQEAAAQDPATADPTATDPGAAQDPALAEAPLQGPPVTPALPDVVSIEVRGARRYSETQLVAALGQKTGEPFAEQRIDAGLKRLWTNFRVRAEVLAREVEGGLALTLVVVEMPSDREPRFAGNDKVDDDTLRRWALLEEQQEVPMHQAERVQQRLLEGYRRDGFYFAEVNVVKRGEGSGVPDVIFEIREGPKVRVKGFEIHGND